MPFKTWHFVIKHKTDFLRHGIACDLDIPTIVLLMFTLSSRDNCINCHLFLCGPSICVQSWFLDSFTVLNSRFFYIGKNVHHLDGGKSST